MNSKYKSEYAELVKNHLQEGWSLGSFAGKVGVSEMTIGKWIRTHPDFKYEVEQNKRADDIFKPQKSKRTNDPDPIATNPDGGVILP